MPLPSSFLFHILKTLLHFLLSSPVLPCPFIYFSFSSPNFSFVLPFNPHFYSLFLVLPLLPLSSLLLFFPLFIPLLFLPALNEEEKEIEVEDEGKEEENNEEEEENKEEENNGEEEEEENNKEAEVKVEI